MVLVLANEANASSHTIRRLGASALVAAGGESDISKI
jgi:hypothetical protein